MPNHKFLQTIHGCCVSVCGCVGVYEWLLGEPIHLLNSLKKKIKLNLIWDCGLFTKISNLSIIILIIVICVVGSNAL